MTPSGTAKGKTESDKETNAPKGRAWGLGLKTRIWASRMVDKEEFIHLCFHPTNDLAEAYAKAKIPIGKAATKIWADRPKSLAHAKVAEKDGSGLTNRNLAWLPRHPNYDDLMAMEKVGVSFDGWLNLRLREELPNAGKWNLGGRGRTPHAPKVKTEKAGSKKAKGKTAPKEKAPKVRATKRQVQTAKLIADNPPAVPRVGAVQRNGGPMKTDGTQVAPSPA